ncbi:entericidin A/B family lipoprotein [Emcibacter sp. SYSU 3D8]|uniref:entericidin A/B family lipoprotein n=1 Tax=Emcibacter sp. SYSU 3D8 TaxID=3133969 RepID=UPI0031FECA5C
MKSDTVKKLMIVAVVAALGACNTVQGAGQDVESVGKAGERELDKAQDKPVDAR